MHSFIRGEGFFQLNRSVAMQLLSHGYYNGLSLWLGYFPKKFLVPYNQQYNHLKTYYNLKPSIWNKQFISNWTQLKVNKNVPDALCIQGDCHRVQFLLLVPRQQCLHDIQLQWPPAQDIMLTWDTIKAQTHKIIHQTGNRYCI